MANGKEQESGQGSGKGQKNTSLYYLHPSDNPGIIISPVQLKGENYEDWARSMRNALRAKKKLGFTDGSLEKPNKDSFEIEDWWLVNSMLVAWIFNTIEPILHSTITYVENVKDLWEDLQQRFSIGNGPRVHQLKTDIAACKQQGQAAMVYYGRMKMMWDEQANYEPLPVCRCGHCTCNISTEIERKREVYHLLMGLDDVMYGTLRSNVLSMEPLPNLNKVYSMVIQEEKNGNINRSKEGHGEVVGFIAQADAKAVVVHAKDNKNGICIIVDVLGMKLNNASRLLGTQNGGETYLEGLEMVVIEVVRDWCDLYESRSRRCESKWHSSCNRRNHQCCRC